MGGKRYSWKSYLFLSIGVLVSIALLLFEPLALNADQGIGVVVVYTIFLGSLASLGLAVMTFSDKREKKGIAVAALILAIINIAVVVFSLWNA